MTKETFEKYKNKFLSKMKKYSPQLAIITGSGVKLFPDNKPLFEIDCKDSVSNIKNVIGHENKIKIHKINKKNVLVFSGRKHLYQGYSIFDVIQNIKLAKELGVKKILITNAAGGINNLFKTGDIMLITGFVDLMQKTERGVLSGITEAPHKINSEFTSYIKRKFKNKIKYGIYAGVIGPSYETFAEIKFFKNLGASAVGMSTIPELIAAKIYNMDYAAISIISNVWNKKHKPSHAEVVKQVNLANKKLNDIILKCL